MLRSFTSKIVSATHAASRTQLLKSITVTGLQRNTSSVPVETEESFETGLIEVLNSDRTSGYEIRAIVNKMQGYDSIPNAAVLEALMVACRRVNDYALAVRVLESVQYKCGKKDDTFNQLVQAIRPTLDKLGILTPEQMGYDKPELYLKDVFDIHS